MEEPPKEEITAPGGAQNPSHLYGGVDSISSLPDEILHHILSFVPTNVAITTSVLSKRWRHVWCKTPYLSFPHPKSSLESILETLASYTAPKIMRFHLYVDKEALDASESSNHVDSLIKFAIAHNVEELSLVLNAYYVFPDFFFSNPSLKHLIVDTWNYMRPKCTVSWTSLQNLSLRNSSLDESFTKVLSGSPMLESLTLKSCFLSCLDLSESPRLRRLDLGFFHSSQTKCHIVAPHIHYLRMIAFTQKYSFVDASSLIEANIDTVYYLPRSWCDLVLEPSKDLDDPSEDLDDPSEDLDDPSKDLEYQVMMQTMLEELRNVENLTVGLSFLQMLSLSEFRGVQFPTFKVKTLTLKSTILRSAVRGIAKLLQNSPELKKIIFYKTEDWNSSVEKYVNLCLDPQDPQDLIFPASSKFKVAKPDVVASFMELFLRNTRTLETLILQFGSCLNTSNYDELSQIALTFSQKYKQTNCKFVYLYITALQESSTTRKLKEGLVPLLDNVAEKNIAVDLQDVFQRFMFDTASTLMTGYDPMSLSVEMPEVEFGEAADFAEEAIFYRHLKPVVLWRLQNLIGAGIERKMRSASKVFDNMFAKIISSGRKELEKKEAAIINAVTYYMNVDTTKYKLLKPSNDRFIRDAVLSLLVAGRDTTSSALTWFFWLLSQHPQVMTKIRQEIKTKYDDPTDMVEKLVYLHAALSESMRLYPPVPFNHKSPAKPDVLPSGHKVDADSKIVISIYALGRMRAVWGEDALEFKPERWILENGGLKHEPSYKFMAFNAGPRTCLGKHLALQQMKMVAVEIIQNYDFKVVEGHKIQPAPSPILRIKHGLKVTVSKKNICS